MRKDISQSGEVYQFYQSEECPNLSNFHDVHDFPHKKCFVIFMILFFCLRASRIFFDS